MKTTVLYTLYAAACIAFTAFVVTAQGPEPEHVIDIRASIPQPAVIVSAEEKKYDILTDDELSLIACLVLAEAEGESEYGQRLVIDTVLNRVDSEHFPNDIYNVVYQKNQFAAKRAEEFDVDNDIVEMVKEESIERTNSDVIFFNSVGYTKYGKALFKEGDHYFSAYKE